MGKKKSIKISSKNIVEYWKNKIEISPDWEDAETCCWACGNNKNSFGPLHRSHIIPEVLGGESVESNLLLLCSFCNSTNPETIYAEDFWKWFKNHHEDRYRKEGKFLSPDFKFHQKYMKFDN